MKAAFEIATNGGATPEVALKDALKIRTWKGSRESVHVQRVLTTPPFVKNWAWVLHGYCSSMKAAPIMTVGKMAHRNNFTAEIPSSPNRETRID
jgi:hypothetical protein